MTLSEVERTEILDSEIQSYVLQGFRVVARTATTAQLVRPKQFNAALAILGLLFLVIGLLIYLLIYLAESDATAYLTVDEDGTIRRRVSGTGQGDLNRWTCVGCGYRSTANRPRCKRCQLARPIIS